MPDWFVPLVSSVGAVASAITVAFFTYRATRKGDTTTAVLTERRDTIADRDSLIQTLNTRVDGLDKRLETAEKEIEQVRNHNNALITFLYKVVAILRRHNLTDEIDPKDVPDGIHI